MSRPYLDPARTGGTTRSVNVEQLPKAVRSFGFYPDIEQLQAGDLILVSPIAMRATARTIERVQLERHGSFDAQWIHAAAYLGDNSLVEISGPGVRVKDLHKYVPAHKLLFRRALAPGAGPVDPVTGYKIAVAALKAFKTSYGFGDLARIYLQTKRWSSPQQRFRLGAGEAICSDYYNDAVARVLSRGAASAKQNPFTPADLAASVNMEDVKVEWAKLP